MTESFDLTVPLDGNGTAPLTLNQRLHWAEKARRTRIVRDAVAWRARAAKIGRREHVVVQLHYVPPDRRQRDPSNLMATQKPAVDGLVDAGVVPDDIPAYVTELQPVIHGPIGGGVARMWLQVRPAEPPDLSDQVRIAIAEDVRFDRTEDARDRYEEGTS